MSYKLVVSSALTLLALGASGAAHAQEGQPLVLEGIAVRADVTVDIHLRVYQNTSVPCRSGAILAIHGATASAGTLEPLAQAVVGQPVDGRPVCQFITMDLPGHGHSPPPTGALYGDLTLDDYAGAVIGTLQRLPGHGLRPVTITGHSMGGMVIQRVQQALLDQGSSLKDAFHIRHAILLAPAIPASVPWAFRESGQGDFLLQVFGYADPILGNIFAPPTELVPGLYFGRLDGTIASTAIPVEEMIAAGWISPESMAAMGGLTGTAPYPALDVDAGIFADDLGTRLDIVAFEEDSVIFATDLEQLFPYLTGKPISEPGFLVVAGADAVHGLPQSDPHGMVAAFEGHVSLP